ncbi:hypothetical protein [Candidatus Poriferisodalis sp.]|uniref:hypothetical protein n=1 Tax=Candidatus Poriferisodalis sp. TaxID=3101277 RepID=UPI003B014853
MNSEKRTVRPFRTDARLDGLFAGALLSFGREQCLAGASVAIRDDFERCAVALHLAPQDCFADFVQRLREGVIGTGLRLADTCLVVAARSGYLKSSEVVYSHSLDDPSALMRVPRLDEAGTGERREVFRAATHGVTVDCFLALARTLPADQRVPLVPWRIGTWLSHARFRVRCWEDAELFRPQPLDQEKRMELGLPEGTVTFAEFDGDVADAEADSADVCNFWVDEELLQTIDAQARSGTAEVLQRWLFAEFVSAVIHRYNAVAPGASAPQERIDDIRESLFGRIMLLLAGRGADDERLDALLHVCVKSPAEVIAVAQDRLRLRKAAVASLKGQA